MGVSPPKPWLVGNSEQDKVDTQLLGTWSYCGIGRYHINRTPTGVLVWRETHTDGKEVAGIIRSAEESERWQFQADIFANGTFCGVVRITAPKEPDTLITVFKLHRSSQWSAEIRAQRLAGSASSSSRRPGRVSDVRCWQSVSKKIDADGSAGCSGLAKWIGGRRLGANQEEGTTSAADVNHGGTAAYVADIWELQRRTAPFSSSWEAPFLPHDRWQGLSRWVDVEYQRHPWAAGTDEAGDAADTPPLLAPKGWLLDDSRWSVVKPEGASDPDGWQYALDFPMPDSHWGAHSGVRCCRRRLWRCAVTRGLGPPPEPALALDGSFGVLVEEHFGPLPLGLEAERILADEWGEGCFVMDLLRAAQASELEVGPWENEESGDVKIREVCLRVPCPPNPMAPETSRARVRYRVHVEDVKQAVSIKFEATWTMLDVPYADYFRTVEHYTLVPSGEGVSVTKAFKTEFIKSTLFQSIIETASKNEAESSASAFCDFVKQRIDASRKA